MDRATAISHFIELQRCGVNLPLGNELEQILREVDRGEIANTNHLLGALSEFPRSVMCVDYECIENPSDYADIAQRVSNLCAGELPLSNVHSTVASLTFELDGREYRFQYEYQDDWCDTAIFSDLAALLVQRGSRKRLLYSHGGEFFWCVAQEDTSALSACIDQLLTREGMSTELYRVGHHPSSPERIAGARQRT